MGLPKTAERNIELTGEDFKDTGDMEALTEEIGKRIENQEDEISRFYKFFEGFKQWVRLNKLSIKSTDNFKELVIEKLGILEKHIEKTRSLLENILALTEGEERLDSRKMSIKLDVGSDFDQEVVFARQLRFPGEIIEIAKEVSAGLKKTRDKAGKDLEVVKKTGELIQNILGMLQNITDSLEDFEKHIRTAPDLSELEHNLQLLSAGIQSEKNAFERLGKFEQIHLNILLSLSQEEKRALSEETAFADSENKIKLRETSESKDLN
jgi:hypothetical protein